MKNSIFIFIPVFLLLSCHKQTPKEKEGRIVFLSKEAAAKAINTDDSEGFFRKIQALDVAIQMKNNALTSDLDFKAKYHTYLKNETEDFAKPEVELLKKVAEEAIIAIKKINPLLIPKFEFAKIKTNHYGNNVYYTRGSTIFMPSNIFTDFKHEEQLAVLIHEFWHVLAEQHSELKRQTYRFIGFTPHNLNLVYPTVLQKKLLTNPDGVHDEFSMLLSNNKRILPLITSGKAAYHNDTPNFFNYLKFEVYGLSSDGVVETDENGEAVLDDKSQQEYLIKIGDNTQYIIHPDEIIADNFMLLVLANHNNDYTKFSATGKKLVDDLTQVLKNFK